MMPVLLLISNETDSSCTMLALVQITFACCLRYWNMDHKSHWCLQQWNVHNKYWNIHRKTWNIHRKTWKHTISDMKPAVLTLQKVTQSHDVSNISTETDTVAWWMQCRNRQSCEVWNVETDSSVMSEMLKQTVVWLIILMSAMLKLSHVRSAMLK